MKKTTLATLVFLAIIAAQAVLAADAPLTSAETLANPPSKAISLREQLIDNKTTAGLVAIDEFHSHVFPVIPLFGFGSGEIPSDYTKFLVSSCDTKWQVRGFDPLTSKTGWVAYDGKSNLYTRTIEDKVTRTKEVINGARCVDRFEITEVWGEWRSLFSDGTGRYFSPRNFIVKHSETQPAKYKNEKIPEKIAVLPEGEVSSLNPEASSKKGFFSKLLTSDKPSSVDLFQYVSVLCSNQNGKARLIANKGNFIDDPYGYSIKDGRRGTWNNALFEVPAIEAYQHIYAGGNSSNLPAKEWYFACDSNPKFILRERENVSYLSNGKPIFTTSTYFSANRDLDGVDFVKK